MNKAICTRYHGPTNTRGARITATDLDGNRKSIPYPHELRSEEGHQKAAQELADKMGWKGKLVGGAIKHGYAFVFVD